jgi:hypothetical protein
VRVREQKPLYWVYSVVAVTQNTERWERTNKIDPPTGRQGKKCVRKVFASSGLVSNTLCGHIDEHLYSCDAYPLQIDRLIGMAD